MKNSIANNERHGQDQLIPFLWLRRGIGLFGMLLPLILLIGYTLFSTCNTNPLSISDYYHTNMRDVFVGVLCVIALFLFSYRGYDDTDNVMSNLACLFALGVAFCPTNLNNKDINCINCTYYELGTLHNISAVCFFLILTYFSLVQFPKSEIKNAPLYIHKKDLQKESNMRKAIYYTCGVIMLLCIILTAIYIFVGDNLNYLANKPVVFYLEWAALWAFGISWMTKGEWYLNKK